MVHTSTNTTPDKELIDDIAELFVSTCSENQGSPYTREDITGSIINETLLESNYYNTLTVPEKAAFSVGLANELGGKFKTWSLDDVRHYTDWFYDRFPPAQKAIAKFYLESELEKNSDWKSEIWNDNYLFWKILQQDMEVLASEGNKEEFQKIKREISWWKTTGTRNLYIKDTLPKGAGLFCTLVAAFIFMKMKYSNNAADKNFINIMLAFLSVISLCALGLRAYRIDYTTKNKIKQETIETISPATSQQSSSIIFFPAEEGGEQDSLLQTDTGSEQFRA